MAPANEDQRHPRTSPIITIGPRDYTSALQIQSVEGASPIADRRRATLMFLGVTFIGYIPNDGPWGIRTDGPATIYTGKDQVVLTAPGEGPGYQDLLISYIKLTRRIALSATDLEGIKRLMS